MLSALERLCGETLKSLFPWEIEPRRLTLDVNHGRDGQDEPLADTQSFSIEHQNRREAE
jgi:hypothetical protein